jgi:galactose-1-phosphate uridylyltransferase
MGGGSKRRTKKKSKSKKLTSSEHQRIYDQVLSEIQAKQVAEEEKARQLAEEARAREIQARKDKARRDAEIRYQASLNAAADALYSFSTEQQCPQGQIITRDLFYQRLVELL